MRSTTGNLRRLKSARAAEAKSSRLVAVLTSPLVVAVVTAMMTTLMNNYTTSRNAEIAAWGKVREDRQKMFDRRLEIIGDLTAELSAFSEARRLAIIYLVEKKQDVRWVRAQTLADKISAERQLQVLLSHEFAAFERANNMVPSVQRQLARAEFYFGPDTRKAIVQLRANLTPFDAVRNITPIVGGLEDDNAPPPLRSEDVARELDEAFAKAVSSLFIAMRADLERSERMQDSAFR